MRNRRVQCLLEVGALVQEDCLSGSKSKTCLLLEDVTVDPTEVCGNETW